MTKRTGATKGGDTTAQPSMWSSSIPASDLPDEQPSVSIRDSLYDVIPLGPLEVDLINTSAFLRLQQIKQLGFVYRIWPGATHTRYEHSLGVYWLTLRALRLLIRLPRQSLMLTEAEQHQHVLRVFLAAALLHDIGHYPFSHAIEELGYPVASHEAIGRHLIETGEVADVLERHGVSPALVASIIAPARDASPAEGALHVMMRLLSGALDVDKLDYLPRDARACNVPYGGVDVSRLLGSLRVLQQNGQQKLAVSAKGISPLHSLVHARQEMFDNIYWHHTGRAMIVMLLRAVQDALMGNAITPDQLTGHDDASLLAFLSQPHLPEATRELVGRLIQRRQHRVVVEFSSQAGRIYQQISALYWDAAKRRRAEIALAGALSDAAGQTIPDWALLIDIPKPEKWEMDVTVQYDDPPVGLRPLLSWVEATGQTADDLQRYEVHQRRVRVVAAEEWRDLARTHRNVLISQLDQLAIV